MNLVAGSTGNLGGAICRRLLKQGKPVRAMVRATSDPDKIARLERLGAEIVQGDLKEPETLRSACDGTTTVVSGVTAVIPRQPGDSVESVDDRGQRSLVDAAREAGAEHFVYISYSGHITGDDPLTQAKRAVERHLVASGLAYTVLRPSYFMDTWLSPAVGFDLATRRVRVYGSGNEKLSWIALGDVAEFAALCVDGPAARNTVVELGGPDALSPHEVIRLAEEIGGRAIEVEHVAIPVLEQQMAAAGSMTERCFAALMINEARGDVIPMSATLARLPVKLTPVREYVRSVL